jgi:hypothetical protein
LNTEPQEAELPVDESQDDRSTNNDSPEAPSLDSVSPQAPSSEVISEDAGLPENLSPKPASHGRPNNWSIPFPYATTILLAAGSLAFYMGYLRPPTGAIAQNIGPLVPKDEIAPVRLGTVDNSQSSQTTSKTLSQYTRGELSRFTTKSRTVVSTSKINHDETSSSFTSSQMEIESNNSTPEELEF